MIEGGQSKLYGPDFFQFYGAVEALTEILAVMGVILLIVEFLFAPGFGISGCVGMLFLLVATYLITYRFGWKSGLTAFVVSISLVVLCFVLFYKTPLRNWFVSNSKVKRD